MAKRKTSQKRGKSWNVKLRKLKLDAMARPYDPTVSLRDPKLVQQAILQALREGDFDAVISIYRAHLRVLNRSRTARAMNVSRQYIHRMLRAPNTPSLRTFTAFMRALHRGGESVQKFSGG